MASFPPDFVTSDLNDISTGRWKRALHAQASLQPVDVSKAPASTWLSIEFYGHTAHFYAQPDHWQLEQYTRPKFLRMFPVIHIVDVS